MAEPHVPRAAEGMGLGFFSLPNISWHCSPRWQSPRLPKHVSPTACGHWPLTASPSSPACPFWCHQEGGGRFPHTLNISALLLVLGHGLENQKSGKLQPVSAQTRSSL